VQPNQSSDAYVLLTVLFASVLFFGGIAGTLDSRRLRISILAVVLVLFVIILIFPGTMPICQECGKTALTALAASLRFGKMP